MHSDEEQDTDPFLSEGEKAFTPEKALFDYVVQLLPGNTRMDHRRLQGLCDDFENLIGTLLVIPDIATSGSNIVPTTPSLNEKLDRDILRLKDAHAITQDLMFVFVGVPQQSTDKETGLPDFNVFLEEIEYGFAEDLDNAVYLDKPQIFTVVRDSSEMLGEAIALLEDMESFEAKNFIFELTSFKEVIDRDKIPAKCRDFVAAVERDEQEITDRDAQNPGKFVDTVRRARPVEVEDTWRDLATSSIQSVGKSGMGLEA